MKTKQRSFVVEFRSGRRSQRGEQGSIWGTTDFKALTREVERQSPHLFQPDKTVALEAAELVHEAGALPSATIQLGENMNPERLTGLEVISEDSHRSASEVGTEIEILGSQPSPVELHTKRKATERLRKSPRKRVPLASRSRVPTTVDHIEAAPEKPGTVLSSLGDLAELEAENKRLRQLWAGKLRAQNEKLKNMLAKF